jgi:sugar phosphate isomerase/epimerase
MNKKTFPKLHNAMWPGLVGKGSPGAEPCIDLDTMLDLTATAEVNGVKFDGVDLFLFDPHVSIDSTDDDLKKLADKIRAKGFVVGSVVAPVWSPTGGGSAMGSVEDRQKFVEQVRKACRIARKLNDLGIRHSGVVRIDSAAGVTDWAQDPEGNTQRIAQTFREAAEVAEAHGERLAAEGEICWGGMHSWKEMVKLLEAVNRPKTVGFQADMAHTLLYTMGFNAPQDAILPLDYDWSDPAQLDDALATLTSALRPWTIDFHVAQNDATVKGSGSHDKTGRHCLATDPNGRLNIARHAGYWLRDETGKPTQAVQHICWDGCMFPNEVMMQQQTWNDILSAMIAVRDAHGWGDKVAEPAATTKKVVREIGRKQTKPAAKKPAKAKTVAKNKVKPVAKKKLRKKAAPRKAAKKALTAKTKTKLKARIPVRKQAKTAKKKVRKASKAKK